MREESITLDIYEIQLDYENPRIKGALEKYGDKITPERVHFALQSSNGDTVVNGNGGTPNSSSFRSLKISIKANQGVTEPIKVVEKNGQYICIDGNTRLAIYREFFQKEKSSTWKEIPCRLLKNASQAEIESIRVTSHLVGARPWPAYEKAKYLNYLRYEELMDYEELIALCGGSKSEIERQIDAFDDMNEFYRDKVEDAEFKIDRFSGFVELQKQGIKDSIFDAGFELEDFGRWIHNGNIRALADVRRLPKVLRDFEAKDILDTGGVNAIRKALAKVEEKSKLPIDDSLRTVVDADIEVLVFELIHKIDKLNLDGIKGLKANEEAVAALEELSERLSDLINYVRK